MDYQATYYAANKARKCKMMRERYYAKRTEILAKQRARVAANLDVYRARVRAYNATHLAEARAYRRHKLHTDHGFRVRCALYTRMNIAVRAGLAGKRAGSAIRDLGCSIAELLTHLEKQFQTGMSWSNYGYRGWHIDHIKPLASFDLTDRMQFLVAAHYSNLQPLWAYDNLTKSGPRRN